MPADALPPLDLYPLEELILASRHLEDLEIFAGQRSRHPPEPGWDPVLTFLARDLDALRAELARRGYTRPIGRAAPDTRPA